MVNVKQGLLHRKPTRKGPKFTWRCWFYRNQQNQSPWIHRIKSGCVRKRHDWTRTCISIWTQNHHRNSSSSKEIILSWPARIIQQLAVTKELREDVISSYEVHIKHWQNVHSDSFQIPLAEDLLWHYRKQKNARKAPMTLLPIKARKENKTSMAYRYSGTYSNSENYKYMWCKWLIHLADGEKLYS